METLVEQIVEMPITNPKTNRASRSFIYMGKVDLAVGTKIVDYKGCAKIEQTICKLALSFQAELYALAIEARTKKRLTDMEYRLIQRPQKGYNPKEAKPCFAVIQSGRKKAVKAGIPTLEEAQRILAEKESALPAGEVSSFHIEDRTTAAVTREDYEEACYQQLIDDPDRLKIHPLHLNRGSMEQARAYLWDCAKRILDNRRSKRWLHNANACFNWSRRCPYLDLCETLAAGGDPSWIMEERFHVASTVHPELGEKAHDRWNVLTYSSCEDLVSCEMFYWWKYEYRLRRGDNEETEPLRVGSAMHLGMEVFAKKGLQPALLAIDEWMANNPVLGDDVRKQDEQIAKARAMVRAASERWRLE